jgi:hypothetical protein
MLRPRPAFVREATPWTETEPFRFAPVTAPLHAPCAHDGDENAGSSGDETEDDEERIKSSWHHRAMLGDEGRVPYVDIADAEQYSLTEHRGARDDHRDDSIVF